jgi:hypothetical protein
VIFSREVTSPAAFKAACGAYASGIAAADQVLVTRISRQAHVTADYISGCTFLGYLRPPPAG